MQWRTDLAVEAREIAGEQTGGVDFETRREGSLEISRLTVRTERARQALGKDIGTYITIELPPLTDNFSDTDERLQIIGEEIRRLLPVNGLLLVAGLGNPEITPDSLGPKTASRVLATRHITGEIARSTGLDRLRQVAVMTTGVTGQTGIETGEYILSVVRRIRPTAVIAVDALASRRLERLGCTLQISNTGIGNVRAVFNIERCQFRHRSEQFQSFIAKLSIPQVKGFNINQSFKELHIFIANNAFRKEEFFQKVNHQEIGKFTA